MNFLAHLYLSDDNPESLVGNLAADFMRGCRLADLTPDVQVGVRRHHQVDLFTDAHPVVARTRKRLMPAHGRYSGIISDVFYDHFLAVQWHRFATWPLPEFVSHAYRVLSGSLELCPDMLRHAIPRMVEHKWLLSYENVEGIRVALERISHRLQRQVHLDRAVEVLQTDYQGFEADFLEFFPDLVAHVIPADSSQPGWRGDGVTS